MTKTLTSTQPSLVTAWLPAGLTKFLKHRACESAGLLLTAMGFTLVTALLSYTSSDPSLNNATDMPTQNILGTPGAVFADMSLQTFGVAAILPAIALITWGLRLFTKQPVTHLGVRLILLMCAMILAAISAHVLSTPGNWPLITGLGGFTGQALYGQIAPLVMMLETNYGPAMISFLCGATALALLVYVFGWSLRDWRTVGEAFQMTFQGLAQGLSALRRVVGFLLPRKVLMLDLETSPADILQAKEPKLAKPNKTDKAKTVVAAKKSHVKTGRKDARERQSKLDLGDAPDYHFPPLSLLKEIIRSSAHSKLNKESLEQNASFLSSTLEDFGIRGNIVKVRPGPVVTLYELDPAPGTKTSRVVGLSDDVARSMSAISVRVAVVPGRSVIGIELPNATREMVGLRELLASDVFEKAPGNLPMILGKDIGGQPICVDLARMPHLLIAGTTGSGKSVGMNSMILSLLYRMHPDECKFIMIDPKMLELSVYDGIPHLLSPVVTDPSKAVMALKWTVREMEDRYRCMSHLGVRNIGGFNARLAQARKKGETLTRRVQTGFDTEGKPVYEDQPIPNDALPYIVVVVDEMADLMLVAGKDVEAAIQRLAQMARAAGIHIIMATQRPSVDVITGTIKANFPTRISFQVTSKIDSRTILGEQGAENLLGQGDMLYMAGGGRISRIHGPFVSDDEVEQIVSHLSAQGEPSYLEAVTQTDDDPFAETTGPSSSSDELYDKAVAIIAREGKASTSFIQRHLQIGYNRAARIIEQMEKEGVVSPANRVGRREVLIGNH